MGRERQERDANDEQRDVCGSLPRDAQAASQNVGVVVAEQERRLKKHEARRPHGRRSAESRQDHLREQRLEQKQQEGAEGNREGIQRSNESRGGQGWQGYTMNRK